MPSRYMLRDEDITVQTTTFPNGPSYSIFPATGGVRLYTTRSVAALQRWLKKNGYVAADRDIHN